MSKSLDRRTFLRRTLAGVGAAWLAGLAPNRAAALADTGGGRRVVVLGAGLAAAYNLMKRGYDVSVLEAQDRPGGRVYTVRDGFERGGHAEMGAIRIFETHEYTLKYVEEFGEGTTRVKIPYFAALEIEFQRNWINRPLFEVPE